MRLNFSYGFLSLLILFSANQALATFSIVGASGGSYLEEPSDNVYRLWGGMTGLGGGSACSSGICNSCTNRTGYYVCNQQEVSSSQVISVSLALPGYSTAKAISYSLGSSTTPGSTIYSTAATTYTSQTITLSTGITWGNVCAQSSAFGNSSTCTVTADMATTSGVYLWVSIDEDGGTVTKSMEVVASYVNPVSSSAYAKQTYCDGVNSLSSSAFGFCGFKIGKPGDEKVYVDNYYKTTDDGIAPAVAGGNGPGIIGVAFFYAKASSATAVSVGSSSPDIKLLDSSYAVSGDNVAGLENDYQYCFIMGNVDKAYNIYGFADPNTGTNSAFCQTPSPVVGLLDDQHCFISTAAFGSQMAPEVQTFREFRNKFLLTNKLGVKFVQTYYKYSPPLAHFIAQSEVLRSLSRAVLYPLLMLSKVSLYFGLNFFEMIFAILVMFFTFFLFKKRKFLVNKKYLVLFLLFTFVSLKSYSQSAAEADSSDLPGAEASTQTKKLKPTAQQKNAANAISDHDKLTQETASEFDEFNRIYNQTDENSSNTKKQVPVQRKPSSTVRRKISSNPDGLIKIDKDGNYIYKTPAITSDQSSHVRIGTAVTPSITKEVCTNNNSSCTSFDYADMYGATTNIAFEYLYEKFFANKHGRLGYQVGAGLQYASGHGRIVNDPNVESVESFTLLTIPAYAGLVYRFQYVDRQKIIPYISAGANATALVEKREDRSKINAVGAPGAYGAGGVLVNLSAIDRDLGEEFATEYEIKNMMLSLEFKFLYSHSDVFEIRSGYVQGGFGFDF